MTALANDRTMAQVTAGNVDEIQVPVYRAQKIYMGAFVVLRTADGYACVAGTGSCGPVLGVAKYQADNTSGTDGDLSVDILRGSFWRPNTAAPNDVDIADVGKVCYAADDQTVTSAAGTIAGIVLAVDSVQGVLVEVGQPAEIVSEASITARISTEESTRAAADTSLTTRVSTEESTRTAADTSLTTRVSTSESTTTSADLSLTTRVSTEESTTASADTSLTTRVSTSESTTTSADLSLTTRLSTEESTTTSADLSLTTRLSTEESTTTSADLSLTTRVSTEESTRLATDTSIATRVSTIQSTHYACVGMHEWREVDASGDVGNLAAHGGILASDSTPVLEGGTNEAMQLTWVAGNVDQVGIHLTLPGDVDGTADVVARLWVSSGAAGPDPATFSVITGWDTAVQVTDAASDGAPSAAIKEITATIAAADIPAAPDYVTIHLAPAAHAADPIALHGFRLEYKSTQ